MNIFAGEALYAALREEREQAVNAARAAGLRRTDDSLCAVQSAQASRGVLGVQLVESIYGWSVRYDSGLQNFAIVAGCRRGELNGTFEAAKRFATAWVAEDPTRRYAWHHVMEVK